MDTCFLNIQAGASLTFDPRRKLRYVQMLELLFYCNLYLLRFGGFLLGQSDRQHAVLIIRRNLLRVHGTGDA